MKTMIKKAGYFLALLALTACESFDFEQEMGQKIICIISDNDLVYTGMHDLNETESTDISPSTAAVPFESTGMWT